MWRVLLPVLAAFGGFAVGWFLWRWRRRSLMPDDYNRLIKLESEQHERMHDLRLECEVLTRQVGTQASQLSQLIRERDGLDERLRANLSRVSELESAAVAVVSEPDHEPTALKDLSDRAEAAELARSQLQESLDDALAAADDWRAALDASERARHRLQADLDLALESPTVTEAGIDQAQALIASLSSELAASQANSGELESRLATVEAERDALDRQATTAAASLEMTQQDLDSARSALAEVQGDFDARMRRISIEESGQSAELEATLEEAKRSVADGEAARAALRSEIRLLYNELDASRTEATEMRAELAETKSIVSAAAATQAKLTKVQGQLATSKSKAAELKAQLAESRSEEKNAARSVARIQKKLDHALDTIETLERQTGGKDATRSRS